MMDIAVVGTGYVGLVAGTCLADLGHRVICVDNDPQKIERLLAGQLPIYEPGLHHLVSRNVAEGRLSFTTDGPAAVRATEVIFIAVGTPSAEDGSADLSGVLAVAEMVAQSATEPVTVIIKSTVPVGTADRVRERLAAHSTLAHEVVSNPEFLKEGAAIDDFMYPDRIIVGCRGDGPRAVMERLYKPVLRTGKPILFMDNRSAEMSKYTANAFLATRISFINEISQLCERVGADVDAVRRGAGSDSRIGLRFFFPGAGYGGSCFPKDVRALQHTARDHGMNLAIVDAVERVNENQKRVMADKVLARFGADLRGLRVAIWGLAFKPGTDDTRESPALVIVERLLAAGATIVGYDPEAMPETRRKLGDTIGYARSAYEALDGADMLVLVTEWHEFRNPDLEQVLRRMRNRVVFDGRNIFDPSEMAAAGIEYHCIGRPHVPPRM